MSLTCIIVFIPREKCRFFLISIDVQWRVHHVFLVFSVISFSIVTVVFSLSFFFYVVLCPRLKWVRLALSLLPFLVSNFFLFLTVGCRRKLCSWKKKKKTQIDGGVDFSYLEKKTTFLVRKFSHFPVMDMWTEIFDQNVCVKMLPFNSTLVPTWCFPLDNVFN